MIQPNELRLGNWVKDTFNDVIVKVVGIQLENAVCEWGHLKGEYKCNYEYLKPIPLTKKMLAKCGFSEYEFEDDIFLHDEEDVCVEKRGKVYYPYSFDNSNTIGNPIRYLHQLQNIFFALTGKELEIEI